MVICRPLQARTLITVKRTLMALIIVWCIAIGMGIWRGFNVVSVTICRPTHEVRNRRQHNVKFSKAISISGMSILA